MANINKESTKGEIIAALRAEGFDAPDGDATQPELLELLGSINKVDYSKLTTAKKATSRKKATSKAIPRRTILIASGDSAVNQGDVFVGVNGKGYQLKRDMEVEVPAEVLEALRNAKTTSGRQLEDGSIEYYQTQTYPFSVVA
jgi:hypothetical protein